MLNIFNVLMWRKESALWNKGGKILNYAEKYDFVLKYACIRVSVNVQNTISVFLLDEMLFQFVAYLEKFRPIDPLKTCKRMNFRSPFNTSTSPLRVGYNIDPRNAGLCCIFQLKKKKNQKATFYSTWKKDRRVQIFSQNPIGPYLSNFNPAFRPWMVRSPRQKDFSNLTFETT